MPLYVVKNISGTGSRIALAMQIARFTLKKESATTYIGMLWWLTDPAVNAFLYWFLIVVVFDSRQPDFVPFAILGLVIWRWISGAISSGSNAIRSNASLMRSIHIPKLVFVLKEVFVQTGRFGFGFLVLLAFYHLLGYYVNWFYLLLPLQFAVTMLFLLGVSSTLSAIVPFFPDLHKLLQYAFRVLLFLSGVFYSAERLPERLRPYYGLNPFTPLVEGFRDIMMYGRAPSTAGLLYAAAVGLVLGCLGLVLHEKYNRIFPRVVAI